MVAPLYARYIPPEPSPQSELGLPAPIALEKDQQNVKKRKRSILENYPSPRKGLNRTLPAGTGKHVRLGEEPVFERKTENKKRHKEEKTNKKFDGSGSRSGSSNIDEYADHGPSSRVQAAHLSRTRDTSEEKGTNRKEKRLEGTPPISQSVTPRVAEQQIKTGSISTSKKTSLDPGDIEYGTAVASKEPKNRKRKKSEGKPTDAGSLSSYHELEGAGSAVAEVVFVERSDCEKQQDREPYERGSTAGSKHKQEKKKKRKRKEQDKDKEEMQSPVDDALDEKYSGIMSKFKTSLKTKDKIRPPVDAAGDIEDQEIVKDQSHELNDLVPIPQPEAQADPDQFTYSAALPSWLSQPTTVSSDEQVSFKSLAVKKSLIANLARKGYSGALPVQYGVLPALLPTRKQHRGDLCVSAVTGSGKTLSYVLPIVQSLQGGSSRYIRAVVVVPTRELVSQVQEVTELCAAGTGLCVGTAVGNRALSVEQDDLVHEGQHWDPEGHETERRKDRRRRQGPPSDESNDDSDFRDKDSGDSDDVDDYFEDFDPNDPFKLVDLDVLPGHVRDFSSKVDILIATPGRLVEHLRATKGFDLSCLQWLVVDEADRLLDQSFQEWAEIVINASERQGPRNSFNPFAGDPWMSGMFTDNLIRAPKKVVLSATMSSDLDKLGSLRLRDPKLMIVENSKVRKALEEPSQQASSAGKLSLPPMLEEYAVPVENASEKPLYLLKLIEKIFGTEPESKSRKGKLSKRPDEESNAQNDVPSDTSSDDGTTDSESNAFSSISSAHSLDQSLPFSLSVSPSPSPSASMSPPALQSTKIASYVKPNILIFASTAETTSRLHHILTHLLPSSLTLATLTKSTTTTQTRNLLHRLRTGALSILIATDRASRGLDIAQLTHVVSYDVPRSSEGYVHRIGRTARAGRRGEGWTLVEGREAGWFWNTVARPGGGVEAKGIDRAGTKVKKVRLGRLLGDDESLRGRYAEALGRLKGDTLRLSPTLSFTDALKNQRAAGSTAQQLGPITDKRWDGTLPPLLPGQHADDKDEGLGERGRWVGIWTPEKMLWGIVHYE